MAYVPPIKVREVWSNNLEAEFNLIRSFVDVFPFIAMDTEFPGVVFRPPGSDFFPMYDSPANNYSLLKQNVDALKLIQLGLTFTDSEGNMPVLGNPKCRYIWQFNFRDFDVATDSHAPDSIQLLRNNGMDFDRNLQYGVDSVRFAELMMSSGLVCNDDLTWLTFHCAYDFAYLVKVLTQLPLPSEQSKFTNLVKIFFGGRLFDVKYIIKFCDGLFGGLSRVAEILNVERTVGQNHQAGSDSLLTWLVFQRVRGVHFPEPGSIDVHAGKLYGLETS